MIYPSHYPKGFNGYPNPAEKPYEIITIAMKKGIERASVMGYGPEKFRPWIQDFDLGATYTEQMVRDQIKALQDLGITSYMSWDPANTLIYLYNLCIHTFQKVFLKKLSLVPVLYWYLVLEF